MLLALELKCFKKHVDYSVSFESGIVAIRGENEAGKTTLLEAALYAWGGATMLPDSLAETVTRGHKESQLKVVATSVHNGVVHRVSRSKSGAEVKVGEKIVATGQSEVRAYMENILGTTMSMAASLMMAGQQGMQGSLAKESKTSPVQLIEDLAGFQLIDTILTLAQEHLTTGQTAPLESRIAQLAAQVEATAATDVPKEPLVAAVTAAQRTCDQANAEYDKVYAEYEVHYPASQEASDRLTALAASIQSEATQGKALKDAEDQLQHLLAHMPEVVDDSLLANLRQQVSGAADAAKVRAAWAVFSNQPTAKTQTKGTVEQLTDDLRKVETARETARGALREVDLKVAALTASKITESACGICGEQVQGLPRVKETNARIAAELEKLHAEASDLTAQVADKAAAAKLLTEILSDERSQESLRAPHADCITALEKFVPRTWVWVGPKQPSSPEQTPEQARSALQRAEAAQRDHTHAEGRKTQLEAAVVAAQGRLEAARASLADLRGQEDAWRACLAEAARLTGLTNAAAAECSAADAVIASAKQALAQAEAVQAERERTKKILGDQLALAKSEMVEIGENNALIKRLREIRPQIADELWTMAQASIGHYFSAVRGVPSSVVREGGAFRVDGVSYKNLSGSAKDALGIAVRIALTKMFLPNTSMFIFDEPAAAANDERELNMLGMIAAAGFEQVLLITHSNHADSFANQVISV